MRIAEINTVCFVGAGTMGSFNSLLAAAAGYRVKVFDESAEQLATFQSRQRQTANYAIGQGLLTNEVANTAIESIERCSERQSFAKDADLLSESVPEQMELKRRILKEFEALCPERTLLTTNTSNLLVSELEDALARPAHFAALHSHLGSGLFDVVGASEMPPSLTEVLCRYVKSLGGTSIVHTKQRRGYLSNTLFGAINSTAMMLVINGRAAFEEVDRAWMHFEKAPSGPFGFMDFVGLDVVLDVVLAELAHRTGSAELQRIARFLQPYCEANHLGIKTGQGFYRYPNPKFVESDFLTAATPQRALHVAILRRFLTAAIMLVVAGYATPEDVDLTWQLTTRAQQGPFGMLKRHWHDILLDEFSVHFEDPNHEGLADKLRETLRRYL